jgi:hypothetical protein
MRRRESKRDSNYALNREVGKRVSSLMRKPRSSFLFNEKVKLDQRNATLLDRVAKIVRQNIRKM